MGWHDPEDYDPRDYVDFPKTQPVARKQYKCKMCGDPIEIGERHIKLCGVYERQMFTDRMHLDTDCFLKKESEEIERLDLLGGE